jgi:hypothetical protein
MSLSLLLPLPEGLEISTVSGSSEAVVVRILSHRSSSCCPVCSMPSSSIHSFYRRKPADLPCLGRPLRLVLTEKRVLLPGRHLSTENLYGASPGLPGTLLAPDHPVTHHDPSDRLRQHRQSGSALGSQAGDATDRHNAPLVPSLGPSARGHRRLHGWH